MAFVNGLVRLLHNAAKDTHDIRPLREDDALCEEHWILPRKCRLTSDPQGSFISAGMGEAPIRLNHLALSCP